MACRKKWKEMSYGQKKGMSVSGDLGGEQCLGVMVNEIWPHGRWFVHVQWTRAWGWEQGGHLRPLHPQMQILHPRSTIMCKGNGKSLRLVLWLGCLKRKRMANWMGDPWRSRGCCVKAQGFHMLCLWKEHGGLVEESFGGQGQFFFKGSSQD